MVASTGAGLCIGSALGWKVKLNTGAGVERTGPVSSMVRSKSHSLPGLRSPEHKASCGDKSGDRPQSLSRSGAGACAH